jgi:DNA (cytosine-5)-methyltransferase 1
MDLDAAYYNEIDPDMAAWLRELIRRGLIAPGTVDERDIRDVVPAELSGYAQCHFFAGVGTFSYALRNAGWPDSRRVWTVSCPCQPFSAAGRGAGFADERHLWPSWFHLASQCRPDVILGEQVESDDGIAWLDLVWTDMEALGYAFGPVVLPAAGVGAPHGRHRIWFVADAGHLGRDVGTEETRRQARIDAGAALRGQPRLMADAECDGSGGGGFGTIGATASGVQGTDGQREWVRSYAGPSGSTITQGPGPVNGFWADAEWLPCRDGKARPAKRGIQPLVDGAPARVVRGRDSGVPVDADATAEARVMRLRGYGNGIVATAAEAVIRAYMAYHGNP